MKEMKRQNVKALIELSNTVEEANEVIEKYTDLETVKEKIAFLKGMFDWEIIDKKETDSDEMIYNIALNAIISKKWL